MPTAPAFRARSMRASISSRVPTQYIWKKVCGLAATTSSIGLLAKEEKPLATPRAAGARGGGDPPPGGAGDGGLAVGVDRLYAGRADHDRHRHGLTHDRHAHVPLVGQAGRVRCEADLGEGGQVVLEGQPALGAG